MGTWYLNIYVSGKGGETRWCLLFLALYAATMAQYVSFDVSFVPRLFSFLIRGWLSFHLALQPSLLAGTTLLYMSLSVLPLWRAALLRPDSVLSFASMPQLLAKRRLHPLKRAQKVVFFRRGRSILGGTGDVYNRQCHGRMRLEHLCRRQTLKY